MLRHIIGIALVVSLAGCGIADRMQEMSKDVEHTNEMTAAMKAILEKTHDAIHLQILTLALQELRDPQNTQWLSPPALMIPFAKTFAEEATENELSGIGWVFWEDAAESDDDPSLKHSRLVSLTSLSAIAAYTPQTKLEALLEVEIEQHGEYEEGAYYFAAARYAFVRDFMLLPLLEHASVLNLTLLQKAICYYQQLKFLASRPYAAQLEATIGALDIHFKVDAKEVAKLAKKAKRRFGEKLPKNVRDLPETKALLAKFDQP